MLPRGLADALALVLALEASNFRDFLLCQHMNSEFGEMLVMSSGFSDEE
jgi:hypothetical protein